ncbi:ogr/Delta-like zinc finger family protein, partial [Delftia tsuruhatensis]
MRMMCPHCNEHAYTRTSLQLTSTSRETIFQCRNFECGHVFS